MPLLNFLNSKVNNVTFYLDTSTKYIFIFGIVATEKKLHLKRTINNICTSPRVFLSSTACLNNF